VSRVFINYETVARARLSLPLAHRCDYDVTAIEVTSVDGLPAMIEFERIRTHDENGQISWSWEATTCWAA
jgi:hypothetical protein